MSEPVQTAEIVRPPLQLVRLPVDKPQPAVAFLQERSRGVMDLIAHFWERLAHTPPLQRGDLHLVVATPVMSDNVNINIPQLDPGAFSGAMLYVPKAHRADVLALDPSVAAAFASYISHQGRLLAEQGGNGAAARDNSGTNGGPASAAGGGTGTEASLAGGGIAAGGSLPLTDLSVPQKNGAVADAIAVPAEPPSGKGAAGNGRVPIDFLTGDAEGIGWMVPLLLPLVHKRMPQKSLVNVVMQLPDGVAVRADERVRLAKDSDVPVLNRWRRQYKEERGILFDADMDALVQNQRVFVYEVPAEAPAGTSGAGGTAPAGGGTGTIVAVAKFDLDLTRLVEIGGVYTFPEYRERGYGAALVSDMAARIRQAGKTPTLQVDEQNTPAVRLYEKAGWKAMGKLARVWLTG